MYKKILLNNEELHQGWHKIKDKAVNTLEKNNFDNLEEIWASHSQKT